MKTLSTLAAVAALIAGMSVASAQMSPNSTAPSAGDNSATAPSQQVTGTGKYCVESSPGGALNCRYASLAACEKAAQANNAQCAPNPKSATTGSKQ